MLQQPSKNSNLYANYPKGNCGACGAKHVPVDVNHKFEDPTAQICVACSKAVAYIDRIANSVTGIRQDTIRMGIPLGGFTAAPTLRGAKVHAITFEEAFEQEVAE